MKPKSVQTLKIENNTFTPKTYQLKMLDKC